MLLCAGCSEERKESSNKKPGEGTSQNGGDTAAAVDEMIASIGTDAVEVEVVRIETGRYGDTATIKAQVPNYTELFTAALTEKDPTEALARAIEKKEYTTVEYQGYASVAYVNDEQVVESDQVVKTFIEKELIKAINAVMESEAAQ